MNRIIAVAACLLLASACQKQSEETAQTNRENAPAPVAPASPVSSNQTAPSTAPAPGTGSSLPDDRTPLTEPKGPVDPKSAEAAGQVVQQYGALIEQKRWKESRRLWSSTDAARQFDQNWRNDSEVHMEIGKPGDIEGAAGSSYVTVAAVFYGKTSSDASFRRSADVVLRRVNDVPGSTEAQRRWHIERIDWKQAA